MTELIKKELERVSKEAIEYNKRKEKAKNNLAFSLRIIMLSHCPSNNSFTNRATC